MGTIANKARILLLIVNIIAIVTLTALAQLLLAPLTRAEPLHTPALQLDPQSITEYADGIILPAMEASGVPGVIFAVVTQDKVLLSKGYGIANRERQIPVNAAKTLFNIASIGKTMTAIVALQLVDNGVLDLDEDVNRYLGDSIKVSGPKLTLRHLLLHHAGFDAELSHLFVGLDGDTSMTADEINRRLRLLRSPGSVFAYDNTGYGVIGMIVSSVTGKPFSRLLQENIFQPLGMHNAIYVEPGIDRSNLASCYVPRGPSRIKPCDHYPVYRELIRGAGGAAASADSMARYMRALLNGGELDGKRILSEKAFRNFLDFDNYRFHPALPGFGFSFTELNNSNKPEFAHSGSLPGFKSYMKLFPAAGVGVFLSIMGGEPPSYDAIPSQLIAHYLLSGEESAAASKALWILKTFTDTFAERLIPTTPTTTSAPAIPADAIAETAKSPDETDDPRLFAGRYYPASGQSNSLLIKLTRWATPYTLSAIDADSFYFYGQGPYRRVSPFLYENDQQHKIAISTRQENTLLATGVSAGTFEKLPWHVAPFWSLPLFGIAVLIMFSSAIYLLPRYAGARRRLALLSLSGVTLLLASIACEMEYGVLYRIVQGAELIPSLWRGAMYLGLLLLLVVPVYFIRGHCIYRRENTQSGRDPGKANYLNRRFALGAAISVAALLLVIIACFWEAV